MAWRVLGIVGFGIGTAAMAAALLVRPLGPEAAAALALAALLGYWGSILAVAVPRA